jgi:hypothetical protein
MDVRLAVAGGGSEVRIVAGAETVAVIDADTLRLSEPSPPAPAAAVLEDDGSAPWALVGGLGALALAGAAGLAFILRRRKRLLAT